MGVADRAVGVDPAAPGALAYPVALKAVSPGLAHKTEAGLVALNVADAKSRYTWLEIPEKPAERKAYWDKINRERQEGRST